MEENKQEENKVCCQGKSKISVIGVILIIIGVVFFFEKVFSIKILGNIPWDYVWPLFIIFLGIWFVVKKNGK